MNKNEINDIFDNAMNDPSLFSKIDIENLLDSIENIKNDYLENKTMEMINKEVFDVISELKINSKSKKEFCKKLIGYRLIDKINELHKGKHIRWIRLNTKDNIHKLTNGGIVVNVKFLDNGIQVLCMSSGNRFIQYKFDECLTFQKLTVEEQLILMAYEKI